MFSVNGGVSFHYLAILLQECCGKLGLNVVCTPGQLTGFKRLPPPLSFNNNKK